MLDPPIPPIAAPAPQMRPTGDDAAAIREAAQAFEALVLSELLTPVFEQLDVDGLGGGGAGERMFRPMLVQQYAERLAASGGVGFADAVVRELMALQSTPAE